ncbi:MAG: hypothetical protein GY765_35225 [bacterium]|nr:hypothetical protein [bacterium]
MNDPISEQIALLQAHRYLFECAKPILLEENAIDDLSETLQIFPQDRQETDILCVVATTLQYPISDAHKRAFETIRKKIRAKPPLVKLLEVFRDTPLTPVKYEIRHKTGFHSIRFSRNLLTFCLLWCNT